MRIDEGIDTGDMLSQKEFPIDESITAGELSFQLAALGADLLLDTLPGYLNGSIQPVAQPADGATYASMISKEDAWLDLSQPMEVNLRKIRAFSPWPIARVELAGTVIQIHKAHGIPAGAGKPGTPYIYQGWPVIASQGGLIVLEQLQLPGKRIMDGKSFLAGYPGWGTKLA
jgi:methionyl-tRNA formyltransferase